jgi:hypothetical protein
VLQRTLDFAASCGHDKCSGFIEGGEFLGRVSREVGANKSAEFLEHIGAKMSICFLAQSILV